MAPCRKKVSLENQVKRRSLKCYIKNFIRRHPGMQLCPRDIRIITEKYREWYYLYSRFGRAIVFSRQVLYYIAERMYCSNFQDSYYVELVLRFIFEVNKDMKAIIFRNDEELYAVGYIENHEFLRYFLKHAYRQKMLFGGYRFPCTILYATCPLTGCLVRGNPLEMTALYPDPLLLHQLLSFGAMFSNSEKFMEIPQLKYVSICALFSTITRILELNPELLPPEEFPVGHGDYYEYIGVVSCCELLLKDSFQLSVDIFHVMMCHFLHNTLECRRNQDIIDITKKFNSNIIDGFQNYFIMPLRLEQIARLVIRKELNRNWALPEAIYALPIPSKLQIYLDV